MEQLKTIFLLTLLSIIFVSVGFYFAGNSGAIIALIIVGGMNFYAYYYSDKQVLAHYDAKEVYSGYYINTIVARLANRANIPMPKVYIIQENLSIYNLLFQSLRVMLKGEHCTMPRKRVHICL